MCRKAGRASVAIVLSDSQCEEAKCMNKAAISSTVLLVVVGVV